MPACWRFHNPSGKPTGLSHTGWSSIIAIRSLSSPNDPETEALRGFRYSLCLHIGLPSEEEKVMGLRATGFAAMSRRIQPRFSRGPRRSQFAASSSVVIFGPAQCHLFLRLGACAHSGVSSIARPCVAVLRLFQEVFAPVRFPTEPFRILAFHGIRHRNLFLTLVIAARSVNCTDRHPPYI